MSSGEGGETCATDDERDAVRRAPLLTERLFGLVQCVATFPRPTFHELVRVEQRKFRCHRAQLNEGRLIGAASLTQ